MYCVSSNWRSSSNGRRQPVSDRFSSSNTSYQESDGKPCLLEVEFDKAAHVFRGTDKTRPDIEGRQGVVDRDHQCILCECTGLSI